uniref:Uncharacterized protein n=1 Tax=Arundo donax TaxID=35708 RepID=A0A0A9BBE2_ARUDO
MPVTVQDEEPSVVVGHKPVDIIRDTHSWASHKMTIPTSPNCRSCTRVQRNRQKKQPKGLNSWYCDV